MASAEVTICNLALSRLGEEANITSLDPPEGSTQAQVCAHFYYVALNKLLEEYDWKFATRKIELTRYDPEDVDGRGWRNTFAWPGACLRIVKLSPTRAFMISDEEAPEFHMVQEPFWFDPPDCPFEIETTDKGKVIFCNEDHPVATYIRSNIEANEFSATFTDALAWLLASFIAGELIKANEGISVAQSCYKAYQSALSVCIRKDANQQLRRKKYISPWIRAR